MHTFNHSTTVRSSQSVLLQGISEPLILGPFKHGVARSILGTSKAAFLQSVPEPWTLQMCFLSESIDNVMDIGALDLNSLSQPWSVERYSASARPEPQPSCEPELPAALCHPAHRI